MTIAERLRSLQAICADARFDELRYTITDYLEVAAYESTPGATDEVAALHVAPLLTNPSIVIAAVAVRPDILGHIQSLRDSGAVGVPYRVFPTLEAARRWVEEPREWTARQLRRR